MRSSLLVSSRSLYARGANGSGSRVIVELESMAATGRFVVVWQSDSQDGSGFGVFGQRYDAMGAAVGPEFRLNWPRRFRLGRLWSALAAGCGLSTSLAWEATVHKSAPVVLSNDSDPYGDALQVELVTSPAHGAMTLITDGSFTYPAELDTGTSFNGRSGLIVVPVESEGAVKCLIPIFRATALS